VQSAKCKVTRTRWYASFLFSQNIFSIFSSWTFHFRFVLTLDMYRVRYVTLGIGLYIIISWQEKKDNSKVQSVKCKVQSDANKMICLVSFFSKYIFYFLKLDFPFSFRTYAVVYRVRYARYWIGLDWIGLDWIGLDWIGLDWIGLDWIGLDCIGLDCIVYYYFLRRKRIVEVKV
jgi:hypothetical protein